MGMNTSRLERNGCDIDMRTHGRGCECFGPSDHLRGSTKMVSDSTVFLGSIEATPAFGSTRAPLPEDGDA